MAFVDPDCKIYSVVWEKTNLSVPGFAFSYQQWNYYTDEDRNVSRSCHEKGMSVCHEVNS